MGQLDLGWCSAIGKGPFDRLELVHVWNASEAEAGDLVVWRAVVGKARDTSRNRRQEPGAFALSTMSGPGVRRDEVDFRALDSLGERGIAKQGLMIDWHDAPPFMVRIVNAAHGRMTSGRARGRRARQRRRNRSVRCGQYRRSR